VGNLYNCISLLSLNDDTDFQTKFYSETDLKNIFIQGKILYTECGAERVKVSLDFLNSGQKISTCSLRIWAPGKNIQEFTIMGIFDLWNRSWPNVCVEYEMNLADLGKLIILLYSPSWPFKERSGLAAWLSDEHPGLERFLLTLQVLNQVLSKMKIRSWAGTGSEENSGFGK